LADKKRLAKLGFGAVTTALVGMTAGLLYLWYYLFFVSEPSGTGGMAAIHAIMAVAISVAALLTYMVLGYGGFWLAVWLRRYYKYGETPGADEDSEPRATLVSEGQPGVTVRIEDGGGTDALKVLVGGETRRTLRNPEAGDKVTVPEAKEDEVEVVARESGYSR